MRSDTLMSMSVFTLRAAPRGKKFAVAPAAPRFPKEKSTEAGQGEQTNDDIKTAGHSDIFQLPP